MSYYVHALFQCCLFIIQASFKTKHGRCTSYKINLVISYCMCCVGITKRQVLIALNSLTFQIGTFVLDLCQGIFKLTVWIYRIVFKPNT